MIYSEAAYFEGAHVAHIAAWCERRRLEDIEADQQRRIAAGARRKATRSRR